MWYILFAIHVHSLRCFEFFFYISQECQFLWNQIERHLLSLFYRVKLNVCMSSFSIQGFCWMASLFLCRGRSPYLIRTATLYRNKTEAGVVCCTTACLPPTLSSYILDPKWPAGSPIHWDPSSLDCYWRTTWRTNSNSRIVWTEGVLSKPFGLDGAGAAVSSL